jgi:hypothetical protein
MLKKIAAVAMSKPLMALLTVLGVAIGAYGLLFQPRPDFAVDTVTDTKVLDVHEPISKLDVTYGGKSLKASGQELRVLVVRIMNSGKTDITKSSFDAADPIGIKIVDGSLLESPTLSASSEYLSRLASVSQRDSSTVLLDPIFIDSGEWIQLKLLVAVPAGDNPSILPMGKIAGVRNIRALSSARDHLSKPLWNRLVGADTFSIQLGRMLIYSVGSLVLIALLALIAISIFAGLSQPIMLFSNVLPAKRRRRRIAKMYRSTRTLSRADHCVLGEYAKRGSAAITFIRGYLASIEEHNSDVAQHDEMLAMLVARYGDAAVYKYINFSSPRTVPHLPMAQELGLQKQQKNVFVIDESLTVAVSEFDRFLRDNGDIPPDPPEEPDLPRNVFMSQMYAPIVGDGKPQDPVEGDGTPQEYGVAAD